MISQIGMKNREVAGGRQRPSAFTLVELLVSVAVIAVGMVFVLGALSQCLLGLTTVEKTVAANFLLNEKMWEIDTGVLKISSKNISQEAQIEGIFEPPYDSFNWTFAQSPFPNIFENQTSVFDQQLSTKTLKIAWSQGRRIKDLVVTRYTAH